MTGKPCREGCDCKKHDRTAEHNFRIGMSNRLTSEAKKMAAKR